MQRFYFLFIFILGLAITSWSQTNLSIGLVAYYPFNGNANDESGNGNNGTVNGATLTTDRFGNVGKAYSFNGNGDKINGLWKSDLTEFSISLWQKTTSYKCSWPCFINIYQSSNTRNGLHFNVATTSGNNYYMALHSAAKPEEYLFKNVSEINQWQNLNVTYSNGTAKLFVNGILCSTILNITKNDLSKMDIFYIGQENSGDLGQTYFNGILDDIRIYNRALSSDEVAQLYNSEKPATDLSSGLVAYYPFNGNANDESGNGNNGTVNGATLTTDRFGNVGKAYSFDGTSNYINIPTSQKLQNTTNTYTYCVWMNVENWYNAGGINRGVILCKHDGTNPNIYLHLWDNGGDGNFNILTPNNIFSSTKLSHNEWFQLVVSSDNSTTKYYLNGDFIGLGTPNASAVANSSDLEIGRDLPGQTEYFKGKLDDIRIYNRALSADEVTQLYNSEKPATDLTTGLVAYYPFNGNANDESGNGNNGMVNGATLTADRFGNAEKAYMFDGVNDYVEIPYKRSLLPDNDSKTYNFWIKFNQTNSQNVFSFGNGDADYSGGQFRFDLNSNGTFLLMLHSYWGYGGPYVADYMYEKMTNFNPYIYHLVTAKVDQRNVYYYLDGNLIASKVWNLGYLPFNPNFNISIGRIYNSACGGYCSDCYFSGILDEVRIYNKALSADEIQALYQDNSVLPNTPAFSVNSRNIKSGESVAFNNTSYGFTGNAKYVWSFGDGGTSHDKSPTHTYSSTGNYTVKLTVVDEQKKYVKEEKEYIHVGLGYVKGTVKDNITGQVLPYSVVFLYNDGKPVQMTKTDIAGNYVLYPKQYGNIAMRFKSAGYKDFFSPSSGVYVFGQTSNQLTIDAAMINTTVTDCKITNLISYTDNAAHVMEKGTAYFYFSVKDKANDVPVVSAVINAHFSNATNQKDTVFTTNSKGELKVEMNLNNVGFNPNNLKLTMINGASITEQPSLNIVVDPIWGYEKQWIAKKKSGILMFNTSGEEKIILSKIPTPTSEPDYLTIPKKYTIGLGGSFGPSAGFGISVGGGDFNSDLGAKAGLQVSGEIGVGFEATHKYMYADTQNQSTNIEQSLLGLEYFFPLGTISPQYLSLMQYFKKQKPEYYYAQNYNSGTGSIYAKAGIEGSLMLGFTGGADHQLFGEGAKLEGDINVSLEFLGKEYYQTKEKSIGVKLKGESSCDMNLAGVDFNNIQSSNQHSFGFRNGGSWEVSGEVVRNANDKFTKIILNNKIFADEKKVYGLDLINKSSNDPVIIESNFIISGDPDELSKAVDLVSWRPFGYIMGNLVKAFTGNMPSVKTQPDYMLIDRQGFKSIIDALLLVVSQNPKLKIEYAINKYDNINNVVNLGTDLSVVFKLADVDYEITEQNKNVLEKGIVMNGEKKITQQYAPANFKYFDKSLGQTVFRSVNNLFDQFKSDIVTSTYDVVTATSNIGKKIGNAFINVIGDGSNFIGNLYCETWSWAANTQNASLISNKKMMQRMVQFRNDVQDMSSLKIGIGGFYTFTPYKQVLNNASTIKIYYSDSELEGIEEQNLGIYKWIEEQNKWVYHGGVVNVDSNYVSAPLDTLYTYTVAPCIPVTNIVLHPSAKAIPSDGNSIIDFVSDSIFLNNKSIISNNYQFTISTTNGTFTTADVDTTKAGIQIRPINGVLNFGLKASAIGDSVLIKVESVQGSVKGDTMVIFTDTIAPTAPTGLTLSRNTNGLLLQWNKNPEIDMAGYVAYVDTTGNQEYKLFNIGSSTKYMLTGTFEDSVSVSLKAYDYSRNYSELSLPVFITEDVTAPGILSYSPSNNVDSCALVTINFSKAINLNSINDSTLFVYSKKQDKIINGRYQIDDSTNVFSFIPDPTLSANDTIYITATSDIKDMSGNSMSQNVVWSFIIGKTDITTSIGDIKPTQSLKIYPNPSTGIVNIETNGNDFKNKHLELININGQVVYTLKLNNTRVTKIDISGLPNGAYTFRLFENRSITTGKVMLDK